MLHLFLPSSAPEPRVVIGWGLVRVGGEIHLAGRDYRSGRPVVSSAIIDMDRHSPPCWVIDEDGQRYSLFQRGLKSPGVIKALHKALDEWRVPERLRQSIAILEFPQRSAS